MLLPQVLSPAPLAPETAVLIQHSLATPWLPFLHAVMAASRATVVCVCICHPPATTVPACLPHERVHVIDWTSNVPGYADAEPPSPTTEALTAEVQRAIDNAPPGPVVLVVDSAETLREDIGSTPAAYHLLKAWHAAVARRPPPSRIVLPVPACSPLLPPLLAPAFARALAHATLHPPALVRHVAAAYGAPPPPRAPAARFWPVFAALAARGEGERVVWAAGRAGRAGPGAGVVVDVVVRRARGVVRALEGWDGAGAGACALEELPGLRDVGGCGAAGPGPGAGPGDPARGLPFNVALTEGQRRARAGVPLPYAHDGSTDSNAGLILYEPDAADDIDDDDPDEDLDI